MRPSLLAAALLCSSPVFAAEPAGGSHCAGADPKGNEVIAVSVTGDFRACSMALMEGAKKKCGADPEMKLTVTGSEFGKPVPMRMFRIDCPSDGGKLSRPIPPQLQKKK